VTAIIILAAGASSRLGSPKQNLLYKGKSLLQWSVDAAAGTFPEIIIIVTGAIGHGQVQYIQLPNIHLVHNELWEEGMGSSIRKGMYALKNLERPISSVVFLVCDQPFVDTGLLDKLMAEGKRTGKGIIACRYNNTAGVPAMFEKKYFEALEKLEGAAGAKKLFSKHVDDLSLIEFPEGSVDIDTVEDYRNLAGQDIGQWERWKAFLSKHFVFF
jgi:molybdenum cofactor cytidylyltransferase